MTQFDPKYDEYDFPTTAPQPQPGHAGHTSPEQEAKVHQLRTMLEQAGHKERLDTLTMLRFLRARKFDVEASKKMFIDCEKWRSEFGGGVDELVRTFDYVEKPKIFEYYPQYYHKTDKDGRPVYIEQLGKVDIPAMNKITTQDRMLQNLVVEYEKMADPRLPACCRKSGHLIETSCTIMDLKGVGISKASSVYGYIQMASGISQNYYPERMGKLYIINAPWGFSGVFSFVKRFLDPVTVAKIHVLGSTYQTELFAQIPKENLPEQFGGTCKCAQGCMFSDDGPWQDPEWAKPPKWARTANGEAKEGEKAAEEKKDETAEAPPPAVGEGVPGGADAAPPKEGAQPEEAKTGEGAPAPAAA